MNDTVFAQELAAVLSANGYAAMRDLFIPAATAEIPEPVPAIYGGQEAASLTRPTLTISGEFEPYLHRRKGVLMLEVRSRLGDETADREHQARFLAVLTAMLGAQGADNAATLANRAAAKAALKAAIALRAAVVITDYGMARNGIEATVDGDDLVSTLSLMIVFAFSPPV